MNETDTGYWNMTESGGGKLIITRLYGRIISILLDRNGKAVQINPCDQEKSIVGNIYIGRVSKMAPNMNAAFVDCPGKIIGYLKTGNNTRPFFVNKSRTLPVHPGDKLLVQVTNDSIKGKYPSVSTQISLIGKYCIMFPGISSINFSGKFDNSEKKKELLRFYSESSICDAGFLIRTNAVFADMSRITAEMLRLTEKWHELSDQALKEDHISEIYTAPAPFLQDIRDVYDISCDSFITDDEDIYTMAKDYLRIYQPEDLPKLIRHRNADCPLSVLYDLKNQIKSALSKRVWLKSGAFLYIEPTQALTAIDVNTGKYISNKDPEKEFLKINQEAAAQIARQIRLRNLSGIILIDFINMKKEENKKLLLEYLKSQLKFDPVKTNIIEMTKLDLVEITRTKIRKPIYEILDITLLQ